jgi:hypothetical protein
MKQKETKKAIEELKDEKKSRLLEELNKLGAQ